MVTICPLIDTRVEEANCLRFAVSRRNRAPRDSASAISVPSGEPGIRGDSRANMLARDCSFSEMLPLRALAVPTYGLCCREIA
jgi:hypothetical protein